MTNKSHSPIQAPSGGKNKGKCIKCGKEAELPRGEEYNVFALNRHLECPTCRSWNDARETNRLINLK